MTKKEIEEPTAKMGRPFLPEEQRTVSGSIRLTAERWKKLRLLGAAWLGSAIDKAKPPKE